ncbi:unnamed protein product [Phaedon cochleariae]|uniref:Uncharacterized protein n=1 Tax=Phaedon cochleariae TaxID=80249 RepID=A0A9N9SK62_PHACE|nr:unnamed protein product [Phaedon cochleariae]
MVTNLSELHFWTTQEDVAIKDIDYGSFKYYSKKEGNETLARQSKKLYCEQRGLLWNLPNKRPQRLRDRLKELEEFLIHNRIVSYTWEESKLCLLLSTGLLVNLTINHRTGDLTNISFDKQLSGRLQVNIICDGVVFGNHVICVCNDGHVLGYGGQWRDGWVLEGGPRRKLNYHGEWLAVWGKAGAEHPQPWSPLAKDHQRANLHLYWIGVRDPELLAYKKTDGEPLQVVVSKFRHRTLIVIEQRVTQRGAVSVELSNFELVGSNLKRISVTSVPLQTQISCSALNEQEDRLLICCIDGSLALLDCNRGSTRTVKAAFIPTLMAWHKDGAVVAVANERGQLQYFDTALSCVKSQFLNEDGAPAAILNLSGYFTADFSVASINWGSKDLIVSFEQASYELSDLYTNLIPNENYIYTNLIPSKNYVPHLFKHIRDGQGHQPVAQSRIRDRSLLGPAKGRRLSDETAADGKDRPLAILTHIDKSTNFTALIRAYLNTDETDKAINLLLSREFETQAFSALQKVVGCLMRRPLTAENARQLQKALGSYHNSPVPVKAQVRHRYGNQVVSLTRRFFHQLVRAEMFETAFLLAVDVGHHDLFMDLHYIAMEIGETEMAAAARAQASALLSRCSSEASNCSRSSCSQCSETESSSSEDFDSSTNSKELPKPHGPYHPSNSDNFLTTDFSQPDPTTKETRVISETNQNTEYFRANYAPRATYVKCPQVPSSFIKVSANVLPPPLPYSSPFTGPSARFPGNSGDSVSAKPFHNDHSVPKNSAHDSKRPKVLTPPLPQITPGQLDLINFDLPFGVPQENAKKNQAKVKFSDTVTAFIVPEVKRPQRPVPPAHVTDPRRELADSLPLCHPNEDYLKDFAPVRRDEGVEEGEGGPKIKVVHFGVV